MSCVDSVVEFVADALLQSLSFESVVSGSDYSLEKWVDLYPNVQDQRVSTQQKLEREQRIKLMKALHGPPHMGKSLVPKTPSADAKINLLKETGLEDRVSCVTRGMRKCISDERTHVLSRGARVITDVSPQFPVLQMDARPVQIREGKQDRALLKLARKKIHQRVLELAVSVVRIVPKVSQCLFLGRDFHAAHVGGGYRRPNICLWRRRHPRALRTS